MQGIRRFQCSLLLRELFHNALIYFSWNPSIEAIIIWPICACYTRSLPTMLACVVLTNSLCLLPLLHLKYAM